MFLRSNKLQQLEFILEKIIGIYKHAGKVRKYVTRLFHKIGMFLQKGFQYYSTHGDRFKVNTPKKGR